MPIAAYLQDIPRPFWILAMVLGFVWHWPIGLLVLGYLVGSGRLSRRSWGPGCWQNMRDETGQRRPMGWGWSFNGPRQPEAPPSGGNSAFDDYRAETLRRLEEEQKEFMDYLNRLRQARDKQEFDQFMAERRRAGGSAPPDAPAAN